MESDKKKDALADQYDDYEEQFLPQRGGGGGKKRSTHSVTSKAARSDSRENAIENRRDEARRKILSVLEHLPETGHPDADAETLQRYTEWLLNGLYTDKPLMNEQDTEMTFMRSKTKAGGQNVNKVNSAVRLTHLPTLLASRSDSSRDQWQNRILAEEQLQETLHAHVSDWKVLEDDTQISPLQIRYFYLASHPTK